MNRRQKLVQQEFLNQEDIVIKRLKNVYDQCLKDLDGNISNLQFTIDGLKRQYDWMDVDDPAKAQVKSMIQSKIYQKKYQEALQAQVSDILDEMKVKQFTTISDYLDGCYNDGFIGTVFDLHGQGIPFIIPINQEAMVRAVQLDSKISKGLYTRLGEDIDLLKRKILGQVSRSIATGTSYADAAKHLVNYTRIGYNNAIRITRTEGHRIQTTAAMDALENAKDHGADVVKQWDSTLDNRTRKSHQHVDGEIRELDEPFGNGLMFPGDPDGGAAEVVNCRCALLQRARWALDDDELQTLKDRAEYYGLDKEKEFDGFKSKYLKVAEEATKLLDGFVPAKTIEEATIFANNLGVKYAVYDDLPIDMVNLMNEALLTIPEECRPVFVGSSKMLEQYRNMKLPRNSKNFYGVSVDTDAIFLGTDKSGTGALKTTWDFDTYGNMVGISSYYKTADRITEAKRKAQETYMLKHNGSKWFFNEYGESTPFHEMGHAHANKYGLPDGFERDATRWAKESKCDMLKNPTEAWAEAWGAYHTKNPDLPDYMSIYIEKATAKNNIKNGEMPLMSFDDDGIIYQKKVDFKKAFEDGEISTRISPQKQARHIKGTKEFTMYVEKLSANDDFPSYIREDLTIDDLETLVVSKLKGNIQVNEHDEYREFVMCDEIIGYYYTKKLGKYIPTRCVQIKYAVGKGNIHIIPVKEF